MKKSIAIPLNKLCWLLALLMILPFISICQTKKVKTFVGDYPINSYENGKATYTYYDDPANGERIKVGSFKFSVNKKDDLMGSFSQVISGTYKEGLKNGTWTYDISYKDYPYKSSDGEDYSATGTITLKAVYLNGMPDGNWVYTVSLKQRTKMIRMRQLVYSSFKDLKTTAININYKNGVMVGKFTATDKETYELGQKISTAVGQFDREGNMDGKWMTHDNTIEYDSDYRNGLTLQIIKRQFPSGKVIRTYVIDEKSLALDNDVKSGKMTIDSIAKIGYDYSSGDLLDEKELLFINELLYSDEFLLIFSIDGDLTVESDTPGYVTHKRSGGKYRTIAKIK